MHLSIYGCELIKHAGVMLHCPELCVATAKMYFQKFYRRKEHREKYSPFFVSMTCIYLATKVDEEKRRHRDVLNVFDRILKKKRAGKTAGIIRKDLKCIDPYSERYRNWRIKMMKMELVLLRALGYNLLQRHPHDLILQYLNFYVVQI
eukprot:UN23859